MSLIEDHPLTTILGAIGLLIGLILPSGLDVFQNFNYSSITSDPTGAITGLIVGVPIAMLIELISGLLGVLIMGTMGFVIDMLHNSQPYGGRIWTNPMQ